MHKGIGRTDCATIARVVRRGSFRINLFHVSLPLIAIVVAAGLVAPKTLADGATAFTNAWFQSLDWFFVLSTTGMLVLGLWLASSRFGKIVLGKPGEKPEFSTGSWLAMLFAAGMGTGILFWGVAEPMTHYMAAPGVTGGTPEAARNAMVITGLHWGLHAWAVYAIAALVLAYFCFRRGRAYLPGEPIRDVFPGAWAAPVAWLADLLAVLAIVFGVAGAITMGTFQIQTGLSLVFGVSPVSTAVATAILLVLVAAYLSSAATSLDKGIKWLSNINIVIALLLGAFFLIAGPTAYLLKGFVVAVGDYLTQLPRLSLRLFPYSESESWLHGWTLTYFVWWIAWAPFVGVFVARISRGRTIQEFVLGVMFVPAFFSLLWFSVLGGAGLYQEIHGGGGISGLVQEDTTRALFALFAHYPLTKILSVTAILLVFVFMVTSVDSATFVLGMLTSDGAMDPPRSRKIAWGLALGVLAGALTLSRSIEVVRAIAIVGAIPFTFVLILQIVAFLRALYYDEKCAAAAAGDDVE